MQLHHLTNPLATAEQLSQVASELDGIALPLIDSIRYQGALLTQSAGILLHLPQDTIAQAIVTFTRFYVGPEGGSFRRHAAKDISAASLYLTAKLSATPVTPRSLLNVYAYLLSAASPISPSCQSTTSELKSPSAASGYTLTQGEHQSALLRLQRNESLVLRHLAFKTGTVLPHTLALTYLSTLSALPSPPTNQSKALAARTIAHLNSALLSPQLLYVTQQPHVLAVAAIYLAAREVGVALVGDGAGEWWRVFDVGREELGFAVVALLSFEGWVRREREDGRGLGKGGRWLVDLEDVEREMGGAGGSNGDRWTMTGLKATNEDGNRSRNLSTRKLPTMVNVDD